MRGVAAAILLTALVLLTYGSRAAERTGGDGDLQGPLPPGIGARDPRIRVDPTALPWRAVGKLQAASTNLRVLCTATLVGRSTVATAAHCLYNRRTQYYFAPQSLHFLIGFSSSGYSGDAVGIGFEIADGYDTRRPKETIGSDWALVFLDHSLGSNNRVLPIASEQPPDGANVMLGGYQQDHPLLLIADIHCHIDGRVGDASGRVLLHHNCAGTRGVSGAPLLIDTGRGWQVVGIDVAAKPGVAEGVAAVLGNEWSPK